MQYNSMDLSFNMDCILGDSLPRRIVTCGEKVDRKGCLISKTIAFDDREESMLPDSSLSPSNHHPMTYIIDESKLNDMECVNKSIDKKEMLADVGVHREQCRLVVDATGAQYLVADTYLVPIIVEPCKNIFDNPVESPSKECTTTITTTTTTSYGQINCDKYAVTDNIRGEISESFLFASQLALAEVKLNELEKELSVLDDYCFSRFVNSAANLAALPGQTFLPNVNDGNTSSLMVGDMTEINERDDARRIRLRQIIRKHSELKKCLSKIKKKLKEKKVSKLRGIVDFSARSDDVLPLPDYIKHDRILTTIEEDTPTTPNLQYQTRDKTHFECLSDLMHYDRDNDNITRVRKIQPTDSQEPMSSETMKDKSSFYEKNIFSTILCLSKESSDRDSIPLLTYEYENYRDSDGRSKRTKCNSDDQVVSIDSECLNNRSPPTPDLRRAELDFNDISDGIRVLVIQKDYLRAGVINLTNKQENDQKLWRVTMDGDRKHQDLVISEWQLLEQGVREVIPTSISQLAPESRVCANWSIQLPMNLYPGTISLSSRGRLPSLNKLPIDFDDGDHKDVDLDQVRLLPENFPNLHELMKASHFADSNFYSLDRKNRIRKNRVVRLARTEVGDDCYKESKLVKESGKIRKKSVGNVDQKKKKLVVHWKLIKKSDVSPATYELVRNIDNLCIKGGENVQLLSYSRHNYMANVVSVLARHQSSIMKIEFNWYYILSDVQDNSDIIKRLKRSSISKKVIFKTSHSDVNDVYSVLRKIEVLPFNEYELKYLRKCCKKEVPDDSYVMAGRYNLNKTRVESLDENIRHYILSSCV